MRATSVCETIGHPGRIVLVNGREASRSPTKEVLVNVRPAPTGYALVIDSTGERHTIGRKLVIGRESAEIAVDDLEVSRRHATIRPLDDGGLELYDLDSANGTFVNDVRVGSQPLRLEAGDVIRVGQSALRVERLTSATERKRLPTVIRRRDEIE
jgi:pSer/pThr/pTyr-binding forkhead associated (FHA) protein